MRRNGFSLLEMMFATVILLVGLIAVAQLVPAAILMNHRNQTDSSALVFAQRELDQMLDQPLNAASFTDSYGNLCSLGDPTLSNQVQPNSSAVTLFGNQAVIDFTAPAVANFSFLYPDPATADPTETIYEVRWAVILIATSPTVYSKRIILGVRQYGGNGYFQPVSLDTTVSR